MTRIELHRRVHGKGHGFGNLVNIDSAATRTLQQMASKYKCINRAASGHNGTNS